MAKPVEIRPVIHDAREELHRKLENAPLEHADALLAGYEVLQLLHDSGTLDLVRGVLGAGDEVARHLVGLATQPEAVRGLRNLLVLSKLLGSIDPEVLHGLVSALPAAIEQKPADHPPSLFAIFRQMSSRNSRRTLAMTAAALESIGKGFDPNKRSNH